MSPAVRIQTDGTVAETSKEATMPDDQARIRPRLVKIVRDRVGDFLGATEVSYVPVPDADFLPNLRRKLGSRPSSTPWSRASPS